MARNFFDDLFCRCMGDFFDGHINTLNTGLQLNKTNPYSWCDHVLLDSS